MAYHARVRIPVRRYPGGRFTPPISFSRSYLPRAAISGPRRYAMGSVMGSSLGATASVVAAIINGVVTVGMGIVSIVMNERAEARARRQWEDDQAAALKMREEEFAALEQDNALLKSQIQEILGGGGVYGETTTAGGITGLSPEVAAYVPYILLGLGGLLVGALVFRRKK